MTTANSFISPQTPKTWTAVATAAETAFNAPTAIITLIDDAVNTSGALVTALHAIPRAAIATATNCQLYKKVGTTYTLIDSQLMATVTPAAAVANPKTDFGYSFDTPLFVEANTGLVVAIGQAVANGIVFKAQGGSY